MAKVALNINSKVKLISDLLKRAQSPVKNVKPSSLFQNRLHPRLVLQIPLDGFANALLELMGRCPAEFTLDFGSVDRITAVMAGPVFDEGNEFARMTTGLWREFINSVADQFHDTDVRPFVVTADVVGLAVVAACEQEPERFAMVAHVEPVADVHAIAIDGDGFAGEDTLDDDGDELFGKLKRTVVVRAICDNGGQAIGVMIGAHEHVAGGFAGGVRRIGRVRRGLGEETGGAEGTVNFIRRDMMEAMAGFRVRPESAAGFQQIERAVDVGGDEIAGAGDGAIHVGFSGEVHHVGDVMFLHHLQRSGFIAQVYFLESIFGMVRDFFQVREMAGIGEAIQVHELGDLGTVDDVLDKV
jgi:hypothetical protein